MRGGGVGWSEVECKGASRSDICFHQRELDPASRPVTPEGCVPGMPFGNRQCGRGAGMARAWRGLLAITGFGGAGVARRGTGSSCDPCGRRGEDDCHASGESTGVPPAAHSPPPTHIHIFGVTVDGAAEPPRAAFALISPGAGVVASRSALPMRPRPLLLPLYGTATMVVPAVSPGKPPAAATEIGGLGGWRKRGPGT
eukprot:gene20065-biopygen23531